MIVTNVAQNYGHAVVSALPYLLMFIVSVVSTHAADFLLNKGYDRTPVRKCFNSLANYLPATIALLCLAVGSNGCHYSSFMVSCD